MNNKNKGRQRSVQQRALETREKIADGAIRVLAERGIAGLTHRAVSQAGGVSLAATTYHFETKSDMLEAVSRVLLEGYLFAFDRLGQRLSAGAEVGLGSLDDLVARVVLTALGRERIRSLAWCEIVLNGGRSPEGRRLVSGWYRRLDELWFAMGARIGREASRQAASRAIDLAIGLTFMLHALQSEPAMAVALLAGQVDAEEVLLAASAADPGLAEAEEEGTRQAETRRGLIDAAIGVLMEEGAAGLSYRSVSERAGVARSGPAYHFPTIDGLLGAAQRTLFRRAKERYRAGLGTRQAASLDAEGLLDLTTAVFFREALEFPRESIAYYSIWTSAAQKPALRPLVASAILDQQRAWQRRLAPLPGAAAGLARPLRAQALFIGKLMRTVTTETDIAGLSRTREDFAAVLFSSSSAGSVF